MNFESSFLCLGNIFKTRTALALELFFCKKFVVKIFYYSEFCTAGCKFSALDSSASNSCSRRHHDIVLKCYRSYELAVTAYKNIFSDNGFIFVDSVIVTCNHSCPDICALINRGIAYVAQMSGFYAFKRRLFNLYEISYM